ncbi:hypothetical protein LSH36_458g02070 [Paralvinella palmiformis]|uniref:Uncharacterized protein n=1 Tax=Paralvinella palmiformis TaxID=53620 RepID=A0AAD9J9T2_9ANNE|nr:hypothetical protein LSH36_458g02070 [Paralvinella palmiformis]
MANTWNMVWLQQRRGPPPKDPFFSLTEVGMTSPRLRDNQLSPSMEKTVEHLCRPTKASAAKMVESPWMKRLYIPSYMESGKYQWDQMTLLEDCKKCTWTDEGTVKQGKKI